jgi:hypothetical protein
MFLGIPNIFETLLVKSMDMDPTNAEIILHMCFEVERPEFKAYCFTNCSSSFGKVALDYLHLKFRDIAITSL